VAAHKAIEKTISDLKVEQLDLFLIHWPVAFVPGSERLDPKASLVETWRAMEELVRDNKTRYIGISNFAPADVNAILGVCDICPYAHEFETHPYLQQEEYVVWHLQRGIKVIAYSPLANTNPHYHSGIPLILDDPFWKMMAERKNATVAQTVLAWGRQRGTVVIPKSVHENYIDENLGSLDIVFAEEEMLQVAAQDKKLRMNDPGRAWGVDLFEGLDDPTTRLLLQGEAEL
jgi:diketogulonate reductase-like aldo/keto reductase